jgi:hypothetical protein
LASTGSGQRPVAGCCECGDDPSGSSAQEFVSSSSLVVVAAVVVVAGVEGAVPGLDGIYLADRRVLTKL